MSQDTVKAAYIAYYHHVARFIDVTAGIQVCGEKHAATIDAAVAQRGGKIAAVLRANGVDRPVELSERHQWTPRNGQHWTKYGMTTPLAYDFEELRGKAVELLIEGQPAAAWFGALQDGAAACVRI